jgi:hypothetical protein
MHWSTGVQAAGFGAISGAGATLEPVPAGVLAGLKRIKETAEAD